MCEPLSRRQFIRYASMAAATPLVWKPVRAFGQTAAGAVPINLELVTVTDTSAVLTWFTCDPSTLDSYGRPEPLPADTIVEIGTSPLNLQRVVERNDETPYHYVELSGLAPGQPYFYRCISNGITAVPTQGFPEPPATGTFTTLVPPPGRLLLTMAWANDLHIGEGTSGLAYGNLPPGYTTPPGEEKYWSVMAKAATAESKARGAQALLLAGDLTSEGTPDRFQTARGIFDTFGTYRTDYWVARGNHDRAHAGAAYAGCMPAPTAPGYNDCLLNEFFPGENDKTAYAFDKAGIRFCALDTVNITTGTGSLPMEQADWLRGELEANSSKPTFIFGHHPISEEGRATSIGAPGFSLSQQDAQRVEEIIAANPNVVGVYSGHTHRNKRTRSVIAPNVPFIELGATKEYPGGYGLVRVYEGGYMVNFYKTRGDAARAWSERSRGEYLGLYPYYTLGSFGDRNFTVAADFSDAASTVPANGSSDPAPSTGNDDAARAADLPATGAGAAAGIAGAAALAAGLGARRLI